jgi:hypothetical protein
MRRRRRRRRRRKDDDKEKTYSAKVMGPTTQAEVGAQLAPIQPPDAVQPAPPASQGLVHGCSIHILSYAKNLESHLLESHAPLSPLPLGYVRILLIICAVVVVLTATLGQRAVTQHQYRPRHLPNVKEVVVEVVVPRVPCFREKDFRQQLRQLLYRR